MAHVLQIGLWYRYTMVTNKQNPTKRTRRAASPKPQPVIDPSVKPSVEDFDPAVHTLFHLRNVGGTPTIERKSAEKPMALPTGVTQPTDDAGNVVRTTAIVTKSDEALLASTVELLTRFPQARESWVVALRTARWTRKQNPPVTREDGTPFLSCDRLRWGTNGVQGVYHAALAVVNATPAKSVAKKPATKRAAKPAVAKTTPAKPATKRVAKKTA